MKVRMTLAAVQPALCDGPQEYRVNVSDADRDATRDDLWAGCPLVRESLDQAIDAAALKSEAEEADDISEEALSLEVLEYQVWVELDLLLRTLSRLRGPANKAPVPSQILGLLPPPPNNDGWPKEFDLANIATQLKERFDAMSAEEGGATAARLMNYVPIDHSIFPARRRAQRLSFAIWGVVGGEGVQLQPLLDTSSTKDRLRLALLRIRDVQQKLSTS
jgi:hypothetical protein